MCLCLVLAPASDGYECKQRNICVIEVVMRMRFAFLDTFQVKRGARANKTYARLQKGERKEKMRL